ncbi:hypothetical protein CRENBAI_018415 [Crenichthys baileyi]|uniref:Uncharacterized protein n=1 Tax=Crenichthys baileyi TaxID=28760 RepID=A0AAV9QQ58_9TELE
MDLALGQADGDTKSLLKELLLNLVEECTAFVLSKIRKRRIRLGDVEAVVGNALLKAFADALQIKGKIHPKSFDAFNKLFVKHVKEKVRSSICAMHDPAASFVLQMCEMNTVDSVLPHALRVIKELLVWRCKEDRKRERQDAEGKQNVFNKQQTGELQAISSDAGNFQTVEQKAIQNPQKEGGKHRFGKSFRMYHHRRFKLLPVIPEEPALEEAAAEVTDERDFIPENQESDIKLVDELIAEELSEMTKEKESELKIVDEFISEELSEMTKEKESELKMVEEFICEELSEVARKEISEQQSLEIPGISVNVIQPTENGGLRDGAAPLSIAKPKGVGVRIKKFLKKYSEGRHKRVAPAPLLVIQVELGDQETEVTEVQNIITVESNLSTGIHLTDDEEEPEFTGVEKSVSEEQISQVMKIKECELKQDPEATTDIVELQSLCSDSKKAEQQSSIILLVNALVMQAVTKSKISCHYQHFEAITKRLADKIYAEVEGQDFQNIQKRLNKLSTGILRAVSKQIGCTQADVLVLLSLNDSNIDKAIISLCKKEMLKPAKEPTIFKSFFSSVGKALSKPFKKI